MPKTSKRINLALQGGGAHGALAWGVLDKFLEDGRIHFDCISATSAGAVNACVLAQGLASGSHDKTRELLTQFWEKLSKSGQFISPVQLSPLEQMLGIDSESSISYLLFSQMVKFLSPYQFNPSNFNPIRDILSSIVDFDQIKAAQNPSLFLSATNVKTGKIKVFSNQEISLDAVMASACLPHLFQAVEINGEYYWDGGFIGNPALFPIIYNTKSSDILIIHISPIYRGEIPKTATDIIDRIHDVSFNASLMREMRVVAFITKMLNEGWIKDEFKKNLKRIFLHAIRADLLMSKSSLASKFNTDSQFIEDLFHKGRELCTDWLKQNFASVGQRSSIDINDYL